MPAFEANERLGLSRHVLPRFAEIPRGDLLAGRKPDVRLSFDIFDELAQRGNPVRLTDDMRVQADVHDPPATCAFGVKLIETEPEHIDAIARRKAPAVCSDVNPFEMTPRRCSASMSRHGSTSGNSDQAS